MGKPLVSIVMGSSNDWEIMQQAARALQDFGVAFDARVISAHRSPDLLFDYIKEMSAQGVRCFIAGAGGAAVPRNSQLRVKMTSDRSLAPSSLASETSRHDGHGVPRKRQPNVAMASETSTVPSPLVSLRWKVTGTST